LQGSDDPAKRSLPGAVSRLRVALTNHDALDEIVTGLMGGVILYDHRPAVPLDRKLTDMSTLEGIVTAVIVAVSFVGIAVVVLVRRAARRIDLDPRYDDPTSQ
jgi:hypothetical protein